MDLRVAMVTPWGKTIRCGIRTYSEALIGALADLGVDIYVVRLPRFGRKTTEILRQVASSVPDVDVIHCFVEGTLLLTSDGLKKVEEVKEGDHVYTHTGLLGTVKRVFKRKYTGKVINLRAKYNYPVTCTPEHPFLSIKKPWKDNHTERLFRKRLRHRCDSPILEPRWTSSENLRIGDYVSLPRIKEVNDIQRLVIDTKDLPKRSYEVKDGYILGKSRKARKKVLKTTIDLDEHFCRLIGYYISEGSTRGPQLRFAFNVSEQDLVEDVDKIIRSLGFEGALSKYVSGRSLAIAYSCRPLASLLRLLCGAGARNKHLPPWGLTLPEKKLSELIKGIFLGDGTIQKDGFSITSYSRTLLEQLRLAYARLGVVAGTYKTTIKVCGSGIKVLEKLWGVTHPATSKWNFRDFCHITDDYIFYRISQIKEEQYTGSVYNLEVVPDNSYLVAGYTVHNCQHEYGLYQGLESAFYGELKQRKKPIVSTLHAVGNFDQDRVICGASNVVVTHNEFCSRRLGHPNVIIPHGCTPAEPVPMREAKESYGLKPGWPIVSYVGFISSYKNLEVLVEAMKGLPDAALLIGGGWHTETETQYIQELKRWSLEKLPGRVQWLGYVPDKDLPRVYGAGDVVCYPSRFATESGALLMALSYGKATISSDLAPFREKEKLGALTCFEDVEDLRMKIAMLIGNPELRAKLEEGAKAYAKANSWSEVARRHVSLYEKIISKV